jgi:putative endonuclease
MPFKFNRVECPEPVEGQWFVYLLECKDNSLYCGSSDKPDRRIRDHNAGIAAQWTKMRRPIQLIYYEIWSSLLEARRRESQIKGWAYSKKCNLIKGKWSKKYPKI